MGLAVARCDAEPVSDWVAATLSLAELQAVALPAPAALADAQEDLPALALGAAVALAPQPGLAEVHGEGDALEPRERDWAADGEAAMEGVHAGEALGDAEAHALPPAIDADAAGDAEPELERLAEADARALAQPLAESAVLAEGASDAVLRLLALPPAGAAGVIEGSSVTETDGDAEDDFAAELDGDKEPPASEAEGDELLPPVADASVEAEAARDAVTDDEVVCENEPPPPPPLVLLALGDAKALPDTVPVTEALCDAADEALAAAPEGEPTALAEPVAHAVPEGEPTALAEPVELTLAQALAHDEGVPELALLPLELGDALPEAEMMDDGEALRDSAPVPL